MSGTKFTYGAIDAAFVLVDDEGRKRVEFGPVYFVFDNSYLVRAGSDINTTADVDRSTALSIKPESPSPFRRTGPTHLPM